MTNTPNQELEEIKKDWEEDFYEGGWKPDTIKDLDDKEKKIIEELTSFLPRHMPYYDWNLPYAEEIILIIRRARKINEKSKHLKDRKIFEEIEKKKEIDYKEVYQTAYNKGKSDAIKIFEEMINSKEKRGVIILDAQVVNEELIRKHINPTKEEEIELLKEKYELNIKSVRIDERNKVCEELKAQLKESV